MKTLSLFRRFASVCSVACVTVCALNQVSAEDWPQFRGARGAGRSEKSGPIEFGVGKNMEWAVATPKGHSSPCVSGSRIFLTGADREARKLITLCVDREKGTVLWQRERVVEKLERCHGISNGATATPATDGKTVFAYFSSYGVTVYDFDGKELWTRPLPVAMNRMGFGSGTSPILAGGLLLIDVHGGGDSHLLALRPENGETAWKAANPLFNEGWSTPFSWREGDEDVVGVLNASRLTVRRLKDGSEKWWISGLPNQTCATPAVHGDALILTGTGVLGESSEMISPPPFDEMLGKYDANKDEKISTEEIPKTLLVADRKGADGAGNMALTQFLGFQTGGKSMTYQRADWDLVRSGFEQFKNSDFGATRAMAVRTGGEGDVSKTAVLWSESKGVPEVPSPLVVGDKVYLVKSGGTVICRDATSGKTAYEERLGATGEA
jgi:outer membrane protein assembly factor BamB